MENACTKLLFAVLQGDDYDDTVHELTEQGVFVTVLSSTGGFLKKKSVTIMIGTNDEQLEKILATLKKNAGRRTETVFKMPSTLTPNGASPVLPAIPMNVAVGGTAVFIVDHTRMEKF